jgi:hypothetical protein
MKIAQYIYQDDSLLMLSYIETQELCPIWCGWDSLLDLKKANIKTVLIEVSIEMRAEMLLKTSVFLRVTL